MHFLLGIIGIAIAAYVWAGRARAAADIANDLAQLPAEARAAARRWNFKRRTDVHPVEAIEDPRLAIAGLAAGFLELDDLPTREGRERMDAALRDQLRLTEAEAEELTTLGAWFVRECGGPQPAISRLARKLYRMDKGASLPSLMAILTGIAEDTLSRRQSDALEDIRRAFHIT
ncbi:MAG: hypothetical protein AAFY38_09750 [Pseudomonadota bacterium]